MKSNGGVLSRRRGRRTSRSRPCCPGPRPGRSGAALVAQRGRLRPGAHLRRRRYVDRRHRRDRRRAGADHRGHGRRLPEQDPDDRRRHRRRRRRLDRLGLARGHAEGRAAVGRAPTRARSATAAAAPSRPSPTRTCCSAASRRTCSAARSRSTSTPRRAGLDRPGASGSGSALEECADAASWRSPRGTRPTRCARSPSSAASTSATSRWRPSAGRARCSLCRLVDILGLRGVLVPPNPGNLSAFGLLTVDVRNDYVQTAVARHDAARRRRRAATFDELAGQAATRAGRGRASRAEEQAFVRTADLRYFGQAYEVRVACPTGPSTPSWPTAVAEALPRRAPRALRLRLPRRPAPAGRVGQPAGHRRRPDPHAVRCAEVAARRRDADAARDRDAGRSCFDELGRRRAGATGAPDLGAGDVRGGPGGASRSSARLCRCIPGFAARSTQLGNLLVTAPRRRSDSEPTAHGQADGRPGRWTRCWWRSSRATWPAVEQEVETAIGRTSRSPMIRDAHDFRAGIHDRRLRKLTGRSYSALVHPVARDYPLETMRPGRRVLPQRRLPVRGRHRPPARPVRDGAGVPRRRRRVGGRRVRAGVRPPRRHRRRRARLDALARHQRLRGGPDGPADPAVGRGRAQRGGADDHDPQLADARVARRRPGRRVLGLPDGRAAAGRAVRPLRARDRRGAASTRSSTTPPRRTGARSSPRSRSAPTSGRTTPSTTASTSRGCTPSGSR